jgi:1-deoxy-D-xylulose-5-phosphate synthase
MRWVKPLDRELVLEMAASHRLLVTVEDNIIIGGAGSAVSECLAEAGVLAHVLHLGLPDRNIEHAAREEMLTEAGLDATGIQRDTEAFAAKLTELASRLTAGNEAGGQSSSARVLPTISAVRNLRSASAP